MLFSSPDSLFTAVDNRSLYLPFVGGGRPQEDGELPCGMDGVAHYFVTLVLNHPDQRRKRMDCDNRLVRAAQERCWVMDGEKHYSHRTLGGVWANQFVLAQGYTLPYPKDTNCVESWAAGYVDVETTFTRLLGSPQHRIHLLGLDPFFARQTVVGAAWFTTPVKEDGRFPTILVFLSAPLEGE